MGERLQLWAFRPQGDGPPTAALERAVRAMGGQIGRERADVVGFITMEIIVAVSKTGVISFVLARPAMEELSHKAFLDISAKMAGPALEVRIHEGAYWDYVLYRASSRIDKFGSWPEFFAEGKREVEEANKAWKGNVVTLANEWDVPRVQVEGYVQKWPLDTRGQPKRTKSKAYPGDQYAIGDCRQVCDFLNAMGVALPTSDNGTQMYLSLPVMYE